MMINYKNDDYIYRIMQFCAQKYWIILIIILSLSYFSFGTYRNWPYKIESDGKYYYQYLVSLALDSDIDFTNNYKAKKYEWMRTEIDHYNFRDQINPITGKPGNVFTIGPAILWAPFFLFSTFIGKIMLFLTVPVDMNPYGRFYQYTVMYSGVIYCLVGLFLLYQLLRQLYQESTAKVVIWLILIATPLYYYTVFEVSMSHAYDFFSFTTLLYLFKGISKSKRHTYFALLGFISALHVLIRTQNILNVTVFSILLFLRGHRWQEFPDRQFWQKICAYAITFAVGLSPLFFTNMYLYGHPFTIPQGKGFLQWDNPHIVSLLFSERNGLFSHHPILLVGLIGYIALLANSFRETERFSFLVVLLIAVILQVYINSIVSDWWAGHSYGQRRMVSSLPLFAYGLGYLFQRIQLHSGSYAKNIIIAIVFIGTIMGCYLTFIHVFLWDYNEPHDILKWMFYYAPLKIVQKLFQL